MTTLAFIDTETTGFDPRTQWLWEFGGIIVDTENPGSALRLHWHYAPLSLAQALPESLAISRYHERQQAAPGQVWLANDQTRALVGLGSSDGSTCAPHQIALATADVLDRAVIFGVNPHFDTGFTGAFLEAFGARPSWDYHLENITSRIGGFLQARGQRLPPGSKCIDAYHALGLYPDPEGMHTAMRDASAVCDAYDLMESQALLLGSSTVTAGDPATVKP